MYTLSYALKPWRETKAVADRPSILRRVRETAAWRGVDSHIGYRHWVKRASWSRVTEARLRVAELGRLPGNASITKYGLPRLGRVLEVISHRLLCLAYSLVLDSLENLAVVLI
jgi:hypothetical protein